MENNKTLLIVVAALAVLTLVVGSALLLGRDAAAPSETSSPSSNAAVPTGAKADEKSGAVAAPDAELRRWLSGGWAETSTNCETDTGEHFNADGRYGGYERQGYWRIEAGRLIVEITHEPRAAGGEPNEWVPRQAPLVSEREILRRGPDRMELLYEGERAEMMRCPLSQFEFTIPVRN